VFEGVNPYDYLMEQRGDCCTLTFGKIEEIISASLPPRLRDSENPLPYVR